VSCFAAETTVGANVGGGPKIEWSPQTQDSRINARRLRKGRGQGIPESLYSPQKLCIPLHVPLDPLL
jgi:hypothetical protein